MVLGADTRATEGPIVADKNCEKIHFMSPNIYCCGAGTAADTEAVTGSCKSTHLFPHYQLPSFFWLLELHTSDTSFLDGFYECLGSMRKRWILLVSGFYEVHSVYSI